MNWKIIVKKKLLCQKNKLPCRISDYTCSHCRDHCSKLGCTNNYLITAILAVLLIQVGYKPLPATQRHDLSKYKPLLPSLKHASSRKCFERKSLFRSTTIYTWFYLQLLTFFSDPTITYIPSFLHYRDKSGKRCTSIHSKQMVLDTLLVENDSDS